jgi:hypothetical protein
MTEKQIDLLKIKKAMRDSNLTPKQLGSLMRQYYERHLKDEIPVAKNYLDEATALFREPLDTK